jgi:hypothetical protein
VHTDFWAGGVYSVALPFLAIRSPSQALALLPLPEEVAIEIAVIAIADIVLIAEIAIVEIVVIAEIVIIEIVIEVDKPRSQTPPLILSSLPSS